VIGWNDERTIYRGTVEPGDGEWLVGDDSDYFRQLGHPHDYPGLIDLDDQHRLMFKFWRALRKGGSGRYTGEGHTAEPPVHDGRQELV